MADSSRGGVAGSGRGRGGRRGRAPRPPTRDALIKSLPAAIKPCVANGGWDIEAKANTFKFQIITEAEYEEEYASKKMRDTYTRIADSISSHCTRFGLDNDDPSVFTSLLSTSAVEKIRLHTTEQLVKDGKHPINTSTEVYSFIGTHLIRSRYKMSTQEFYTTHVNHLEKQYNMSLMKMERYIDILNRLHGYDIAG